MTKMSHLCSFPYIIIYKLKSIYYYLVIKMSLAEYPTIENYLSNQGSGSFHQDSKVINMAEEQKKMYLTEEEKKKLKEESSLIKKTFKDAFYDALKGTKHYKTKTIAGKEIPIGITVDNESDIDKALNNAAEFALQAHYGLDDADFEQLKGIYRKNPHMYDAVLKELDIDKHQIKELILRKGKEAEDLENILDNIAANASSRHEIDLALKKVRERAPIKESDKLASHTKELYSAKGFNIDHTGRSHEDIVSDYVLAALGYEAEAAKKPYVHKKKVKESDLYKKAA